jgi:hypothetical protein
MDFRRSYGTVRQADKCMSLSFSPPTLPIESPEPCTIAERIASSDRLNGSDCANNLIEHELRMYEQKIS